jgi:hypothetical protein
MHRHREYRESCRRGFQFLDGLIIQSRDTSLEGGRAVAAVRHRALLPDRRTDSGRDAQHMTSRPAPPQGSSAPVLVLCRQCIPYVFEGTTACPHCGGDAREISARYRDGHRNHPAYPSGDRAARPIADSCGPCSEERALRAPQNEVGDRHERANVAKLPGGLCRTSCRNRRPQSKPARRRPSGYAGHASPSAVQWLCHAEPKAKRGGRDRDRTCDPLDVNEVLSR